MKARSIELPAELESLSVAAQFTDEVIRELLGNSPPPHLGYNIALAVSEALTNAVRHCHDGKNVWLGFSWDAQKVVITVDDQGRELNLEDIPEPDFEETAEGGYGVYIIRMLMDEVTVENFSGWKRLTMVKNLNKGNG
jgi:serine/threonine-protein kinase RsbW